MQYSTTSIVAAAFVSIALLWACGGAADGTSSSGGPGGGAGSGADGGDSGSSSSADGGPDPFAGPVVCTSGASWTRGDRGSALMHPGRACIACHTSQGEGERYTIAGTVFPSGHEPDECNGVAQGSVQVIITGADGKVLTLSVNGAGNFGTRQAVAMPYRAKVVSGDKTREMGAAQKDGDCNGCHTEAGANGAPGRIVAP